MSSSTINSRRTAIVAVAAAVTLGAASLTGVANAEAATGDGTGSVSGISSDDEGAFGSSESSVADFFGDPIVQSGGVLILGLGVAAALAIGAGIQGGAFNDVQLPF